MTWRGVLAVMAVLGLACPAAAAASGDPPPATESAPGFAPGPPIVPGPEGTLDVNDDLQLSEELAAALEQMTDIRDIRPPVPYGWDPRWALGAALGGLLVVAAILLWWLRRRQGGARPSPVVSSVPPEVAAREQFAALEREAGLPDKEFYFRLCAIVRTYLDARFGVDTLEMTTEELQPVVRRLPLAEASRNDLTQLFRASDPVRYADAAAGAERRRGDLAAAVAVVAATAPGGQAGG